jgi:RNA polymerase sigma-70 factor (ECF subfamily)
MVNCDSRGNRAAGCAQEARGTGSLKRRLDMAQGERITQSTRLKLISLLPRLRRFAAVLAGDRAGCDRLLRDACLRMLEDEHLNQQGAPFDRWAFAELYALWLERLRDHTDPMTQGKGDVDLFMAAFMGAEGNSAEIAETAAVLTKLPPQQRSAALLIYGDGFSYDEAAMILDAPLQTVVERAARALASLIERTGLAGGEAPSTGAQIESLFPAQRQAG